MFMDLTASIYLEPNTNLLFELYNVRVDLHLK